MTVCEAGNLQLGGEEDSMRSVAHQDAATAHLLKIFLEALSSRSEQGTASRRNPPLEHEKAAQPSAPAPAPPTKTHPGSPPGFNRPAPVAIDAVAAQMLASLMTEGGVRSIAQAEISGDSEGRKDSESFDLKPEEPALAQTKSGTANGSVPWPTEALAAYSARPTELIGLQPGVRPSRLGLGGRSDPGGAKLSALKLFRKALAYTCVIVVVFVLLNRNALFG